MRTDRLQAVFSLTTTGTDIYAAMTRLAIASLRQSNPGLAVVVACDNRSLSALKAAASPLLHEADRWLDVDVPPGCATFRNRHVKTRLRELIDGRFLFLDSDLFIRGSIVGLFELDADVAAVPERSPASSQQPLSGTDAEIIAALDWPVDPLRYMNGGVIYYNDTSPARVFARNWHLNWQQSAERLQRYVDQPALNTALHSMPAELHVLPQAYNHQVKWHDAGSELPAIWHYNYTSRREVGTCFESYARELQHGRTLDRYRVAAMASLPFDELLAGDR